MSTLFYNQETLKNIISDYFPDLKSNPTLFNQIHQELCQDFTDIGQSNTVILIQNIQYLIFKFTQSNR